MQDLIEKLEMADGPDRLLDGLIMAATNPPGDLDGKPANIFIRYDGDYGRFKSFAGTPMSFSKPVPHYTASIDAALALVVLDEGWLPNIECETRRDGLMWEVTLGHMAYDAIGPVFHRSLACALCIAALGARAINQKSAA